MYVACIPYLFQINHYTLVLLDTVYNISGNESLCTINVKYSLTIQSIHVYYLKIKLKYH